MAQGDLSANLVRVKKLTPGLSIQMHSAFCIIKTPTELNAGETYPPRPARQIHRKFIYLESHRRLRPQAHPAGCVARDGKIRADADKNIGRAPEPLDQPEIHRHPEFRQLQL